MEGQVTFVKALFRDPHIQPWFQGPQEVEVANTPGRQVGGMCCSPEWIRTRWRSSRRRIPVVDYCDALQENKDQEKANKVKHRSRKTGKENSAQETGYGCEDGQEETIEEEDIVQGKSNRQEEDPSTPRATIGVVLGQKRRSFGSPIGRPSGIVPSGASEF
jgi:hypothetical protein